MSGSRLALAPLCALVAPLCALVACHVGFVQRAEDAYFEGRYLEAVEALVRHEGEITELSASKRARYGMVRGLSLIEVGDYAEAERWLRYASDIDHVEPTLGEDERARVAAALAALAKAK